MSTSNRRPYLTATVMDQTLLDQSQDNLSQKLEMVAELEMTGETLRLSDRAKYVGSTYYEARVVFPKVNRTVGDWLAGELQFSTLELEVNNTDQKYSKYLPAGSDFDGFIGKTLTVKVGLAELASSYSTVFKGTVTDVGGFERSTASFTIVVRNDFEKVNVSVPQQTLIPDDWPDIEDSFVGLGAPIIYGDWTTALRPEAPSVPAFPVNGGNAGVLAGTTDLRLVISSTPISVFDDTSVTLFRGDEYFAFDPGDVSIVGATDNTVFDLTQQNLTVDGSPWIYETGDQFYLKVKGIDIGIYTDNSVAICQDMLMRFGGLTLGDFDANWTTYILKAAPTYSAIADIKTRVWLQDGQELLTYVLSILEQVRLEAFVDRNNKFKITALHFEDFDEAPGYTVRNWDIVRDTFKPRVDDRNNFNRAQADFDFDPSKNEARLSTGVFRNQAAIDQVGRPISKLISFPNLYVITDVELQLMQILTLSSAYSELVDVTLTSRSVLKDIGDFVLLDIKIGSVELDNVPALVRTLGYNPVGLTIPAVIWSFQMVPFSGWSPGYPGITGGVGSTITQET